MIQIHNYESAELGDFLNNLTTEPGVYKMIDINNCILYIGKAINLKNRVNSYFSKRILNTKTHSLVSQIAKIEVAVTRSETEALLLEFSLIKTHRPKYNIILRDDKSYPYIHLDTTKPFPRIDLYHNKKKPDTSNFFGPYPSARAVRETLSTIKKIFAIRSCQDSYFSARQRPCLQYQIKRCSAPCVGAISIADYAQSVKDASMFLQGKSQKILDELAKRMEEAVTRLDFEEAANLRESIKKLRLIQEQQGVIQPQGDLDVIAIAIKPDFACIQCVTIRDGQVIANINFMQRLPDIVLDVIAINSEEKSCMSQKWQQVFSAFISFYYIDTPKRIPSLILTNEAFDEKLIIEDALSQLRGSSCKIKTKPPKSAQRWMDFTLNNLNLTVEENLRSSSLMLKRYQSLTLLLQCKKPISRMECFDISHTQGQQTIASCVVFNENGPQKNAYRSYIINGIKEGDDYAAMEQVITRRFKRLIKEDNLPDLVLVDGGKAQVAMAQNVFNSLGVKNVLLLGLAKGPKRKVGAERLIIQGEKQQELVLPSDSKAFHLLQHIRDEAHRFAITNHRKKRQKIGLASSLEDIPGVGPARRIALLRRFGGLHELTHAPLDELVKVKGISHAQALRIFQYFRLK